MDLCAIGARIKAAREKAGMTQEDLAAALEMSPTHISVIERGVKAPKLETLVNIANTLNVSSDMLLQDVVTYSSDGIACELSGAISKLPKKDQERIFYQNIIHSTIVVESTKNRITKEERTSVFMAF